MIETHRGFVFTTDTAEAIRKLEVRLSGVGRLEVGGATPAQTRWSEIRTDPGPSGVSYPPLSMRPSGREVYLTFHPKVASANPAHALNLLWAAAIPSGLTPLNRHPSPGVGSTVFHAYGPWTPMLESLWAEGLGEQAWPSLCSAAQLMVGAWEGDRINERMVQVHLHRIGVPCGPVDGVITERVIQCLRTVGLASVPIPKAAELLANLPTKFDTMAPQTGALFSGTVTVPNAPLVVSSYGGARATSTHDGALVQIPPGGRVVLSIE